MGQFISQCKSILDGTAMVVCKGALFVGLGNICGHLLTHAVKVIKPTFFKTDFVDPWTAGICCGIFVIVDFFARSLFEKIFGEEYASKPLVVMARVALCVPAAVFLCSLEGITITLTGALAAIVGAIAGSIFLYQLSIQYQKYF